MRLSTAQVFQQGISAILAQQSKLQHTEQQLATGKRLLTPADDPVAAVQALAITEGLGLIDQYQRNGNIAEGQLAREETVLDDVGTLLNRVRELVVQANNDSQSAESRGSIGVEISARLEELLALANSSDAGGEYIFAGFQAGAVPFSQQGGAFTYGGDSGQRMLQLAAGTQVAVRDSGEHVFMAVPSGNGVFAIEPGGTNSGTAVTGSSSVSGGAIADTYSIVFSQPSPADPVTYQVVDSSAVVVASGNYTGGDNIDFSGVSIEFDGLPADGDSFEVSPSVAQDMFTTVKNIADQLNAAAVAPADIAALHNAMSSGLKNLDQALQHVSDVRSDVGVRLGRVESQQNSNDSLNLQLEKTLSEIQDLDYAEAISRFNLQLTTLQAAQQAYVKMQGLSLFNYL